MNAANEAHVVRPSGRLAHLAIRAADDQSSEKMRGERGKFYQARVGSKLFCSRLRVPSIDNTRAPLNRSAGMQTNDER